MAGVDATVSIGMETAALQAGANKALNIVKGMSTGIKTALSAAGAAFAVVGGVSAIKGLSDELVKVYDLARQLGVSGESLQRVSQAAVIGGTDIDNLVESMLELDIKLYDAANGSKEAQAALDAFGISAESVAGLSLEEKILKLAQAFQNYERTANGAPVLMSLLGDEARELIPLLRSDIAELERLSNTTVVSDEQLAAIKTFDTAMSNLGASAKATAGNVIGEFAKMAAVTQGIFEKLFEGKGFGDAWQGAFDDQFLKDLEARAGGMQTGKGVASGSDPEAKKRAEDLAKSAARAREVFEIETGILELNNEGTRAAAKKATEMERGLKIAQLQEQVMKQQNVTADEALAIAERRVNAESKAGSSSGGKIQGFTQDRRSESISTNPFSNLDSMKNQGPSAWDNLQETQSSFNKLQNSESPFNALRGRGTPLDKKAQENNAKEAGKAIGADQDKVVAELSKMNQTLDRALA